MAPTLIDLVVVFGIAVVLPLALTGGRRWWTAAAAAAFGAFLLPIGPLSAALALPFLAVAASAVRRALSTDRTTALAAIYATVAAGALVQSRAGIVLLGIGEPIVELTAVHYTYAGAASLVLARHTGSRWAIALTALAPPVVAAGFVTGHPLPQVGGAILMTAGVWITGVLQLKHADHPLLVVSGLSVWAPMVLAVAWAIGQHTSLPALSIPDMARTHGVVNALGFVTCGLLARNAPTAYGRRLAAATNKSPTYDHVGSTLTDGDATATTTTVGTGPAAFAAARHALETFVPQRAIGAIVTPDDARVEDGATVLLSLRRGPFVVTVPNRIVAVVDEPRRYAFAYGTLPGHHERGEESFTIDLDDDGTVRATIRVDAVPASLPAKVAAPVVRRLQRLAIDRYLRAIAAAADKPADKECVPS